MSHDFLEVTLQTTWHEGILHGLQEVLQKVEYSILHDQAVTSVASMMENGRKYKPLSYNKTRERSGSVVECLTRDRGATGSSLTSITALCP